MMTIKTMTDHNDDTSLSFSSFLLYVYNTHILFFSFLFHFQKHRFHPSRTTHIMPSSFSTAVAFLLFLVMTSSILMMTTTTTVVVAASAATPIGGTNDLVDHVRKIKNSKKMNAHKDHTCTMEPFLGTSQYRNCKGAETEVKIACDTIDDTTTTTNTTPTTRWCSYSERPVPYEDTAAVTTAVGCGDHGSFDPERHLVMDHATGRCRLNFITLIDSCATAEAGASSTFGVMVEVPPRTGPHHHESNEDNHHKDNSGMLLRFSHDAGVTYYNLEEPSNTVSLDTSNPRRELDFLFFVTKPWESEDTVWCDPLPEWEYDSYHQYRPTFKSSWYKTTCWGEKKPFETCYQFGNDKTYCWSRSGWSDHKSYECRPKGYHGNDDGWQHVDPKYVVPKNTCGPPCTDMYLAK